MLMIFSTIISGTTGHQINV